VKVQVEFAGPVRRPTPDREAAVDLPDGATASDLLAALGYSDRDLRMLTVIRGEDVLPGKTPLGDGDRVTVLLRVGGG
jgi:sulfur carrier protein ThiS